MQKEWDGKLPVIENFIYFYHLNKYLLLPVYPDTVTDATGISWSPVTALGRSAPIQVYGGSGPRAITINIELHRDMMQDLYWPNKQLKTNAIDFREDNYVDNLIKYIQTANYPKYQIYGSSGSKSIEPPMVALRIGDDIFIKGAPTLSNLSYEKPIITYEDGSQHYAKVSFALSITETDPYDAESVAKIGSFRGITAAFANGVFKPDDDDPTTKYSYYDFLGSSDATGMGAQPQITIIDEDDSNSAKSRVSGSGDIWATYYHPYWANNSWDFTEMLRQCRCYFTELDSKLKLGICLTKFNSYYNEVQTEMNGDTAQNTPEYSCREPFCRAYNDLSNKYTLPNPNTPYGKTSTTEYPSFDTVWKAVAEGYFTQCNSTVGYLSGITKNNVVATSKSIIATTQAAYKNICTLIEKYALNSQISIPFFVRNGGYKDWLTNSASNNVNEVLSAVKANIEEVVGWPAVQATWTKANWNTWLYHGCALTGSALVASSTAQNGPYKVLYNHFKTMYNTIITACAASNKAFTYSAYTYTHNSGTSSSSGSRSTQANQKD